jgi:hypothetical protein
MVSSKKLADLYSISEHLAKRNLLNRIFKFHISDKYLWNQYSISIEKQGDLYFLGFPLLDIITYDDNLDLAFLNLIDQSITLYDEYQDHYDTDSDKLLQIIEHLLCDLDRKYQIRINNTNQKTNYQWSATSNCINFPTYAGI